MNLSVHKEHSNLRIFPIYKVKMGSVKKTVKLLFPVVHFFEASIAYLKITFHFVLGTCSPLKKPVLPNF